MSGQASIIGSGDGDSAVPDDTCPNPGSSFKKSRKKILPPVFSGKPGKINDAEMACGEGEGKEVMQAMHRNGTPQGTRYNPGNTE